MKGPLTRSCSVLAGAALAGFFAVVAGPSGSASAASQTFTNACRNGAVATNWDQVNVTMSATSPASAAPGSSVTLSGLGLQMAVPGAIFVAGYNLGLLTVGANTIPATINEVIDATNATPASQSTNVVSTTLSTTISDPDGVKSSGDETATDASASVTFNDMTWTAGASGTINFAEHNDPAVTAAAGGGIVAVASLAGGLITVPFRCTAGTVAGSNPGVPTFFNAPTVTSTAIVTPLAANAGPDQTVASAAAVTLAGSATGGTSPYSFAWAQTAGPPVTLTGGTTASPTFTAPTGPAALTFQVTVTDSSTPAATSQDSVNVNVSQPADVTTTSLAVTQTGFVNTPVTFDSDVADTTTPASIPQGTVSWYDNGGATAVASAHTNASGHATFTLAGGLSPAGSHSIVAKFVADVPSAFSPSQSAPIVFDLAGTPGCSLPGSSCTDAQPFQVTVGAGTLVISTPWTAANPFDLGTMALDPTGTFLAASKAFGDGSHVTDGVTVTDTRAGDLPWTAQVSATDFTNGANAINSCNLGFTGLGVQLVSGNTLGTPAKPVVTTPVPNGTPGSVFAAGASCSTGLAGGPHTFAQAANGFGSVHITGLMDLAAPTSTNAGTYMATVTFTIS